MKLDGLRRIWIALAIVPLMAGIAFASVPTMLVCRGDLVARTSCCCPNAHSGPAASQGAEATLSGRCCCDVMQAKPPVGPSVATARAATVARPQPLAVVASIDLHWFGNASRIEPTVRWAHPPPPAVPILLGKQSFLI